MLFQVSLDYVSTHDLEIFSVCSLHKLCNSRYLALFSCLLSGLQHCVADTNVQHNVCGINLYFR